MRASLDEYFMTVAKAVATRSTCLDKQVGCVLVDRGNNIIATGYNGFPKGLGNCCDKQWCAKERGLECIAVHAEQNALLRANADVIKTCYCTLEPCLDCGKMLLNTSCERVVFLLESRKSGFKHLSAANRITWEKFK